MCNVSSKNSFNYILLLLCDLHHYMFPFFFKYSKANWSTAFYACIRLITLVSYHIKIMNRMLARK
ncbi:hypothetical protein HanXRQr2_Chr06g0252451 [Helianthus annuus]|uniref:Uncharacterized protein n=1 Tax=Helianthus annuus TaxID=4232 RepID=A0A9K3NIR4_HELAN|nr:hypothetical protein HanXRQr2_Chr06g0252451 [Helianthus annuus]